MKFEEIRELMIKDSSIDESNLEKELIKIPFLHAKWYNIFIEESKIYKSMMSEYKKLKKDKMEYYLGKSPDEVYEKHPLDVKILRQDLDYYLSADEDLLVLEERLEHQKLKIQAVENFIKLLNHRGYDLKGAIDFIKFKNGLN